MMYRTVQPTQLGKLQEALDDATSPSFLALSSGEAFEAVLTQLPHAMLPALRRVRVIAASDRLAGIARERGFNDIVIAASARPGDMVAAGQRIGLIRFGSRVDVFLPTGTAPQVLLGQRTVAGETIARLTRPARSVLIT